MRGHCMSGRLRVTARIWLLCNVEEVESVRNLGVFVAGSHHAREEELT